MSGRLEKLFEGVAPTAAPAAPAPAPAAPDASAPATPAPNSAAYNAANFSHPATAASSGGFDPRAGRGTMTVAAGQAAGHGPAPAGPITTLAQLHQQQMALPAEGGGVPDPLAGYSLEELAKPVRLGGAPRRAALPPAQLRASRDRAYAAKLQAIEAGGQAEAQGLENAQLARQLHRGQAMERQAKDDERKAKIKERAEEYDAEVAQPLRDSIRAHKVDPNRRFRGPDGIISGIAMALAAAGQGFIMGYRGQAGPNPILQMMSTMIDRDIALQEGELAKMKGELTEADSIYKRFRQETDSIDEAAEQYHIYAREQLANKLAGMAAGARSDVVRARVDEARASLDLDMADRTIKAWQARQRARGGGKRTTRGQLLMDMAMRKAQYQKLMAEAGKASRAGQGKDIDKKHKQILRLNNDLRRTFIHAFSLRKALTMPGINPLQARQAADRYNDYKAVVADKLAKAEMEGPVGAEVIKSFKGVLDGWGSGLEDTRKRYLNVLHSLDDKDISVYQMEPGANIRPYVRDSFVTSQLALKAIGGGHGGGH